MPEAERPDPTRGDEAAPGQPDPAQEAEAHLKTLGFPGCRVHAHDGGLARVEAPLADLPRLADPGVSRGLIRRLKELGFRFVAVDLEGPRPCGPGAVVRLGKRPEAIPRT